MDPMPTVFDILGFPSAEVINLETERANRKPSDSQTGGDRG